MRLLQNRYSGSFRMRFKMKFFHIILSVFLIHTSAFSQTAEQIFLDTMNYARSSPFSEQLDWDDIKTQGLLFIKDRKGTCVAASAIANILVPPLYLLDHHTFVTQDNIDSDDCPMPPPGALSEAITEWINLAPEIRDALYSYSEHFHGRRIGAYSYIYVPAGLAWEQADINKRIKEGRDALSEARPGSARGVIVDFRHNGGGNNVPMLLALSALLPDDTLFKMGPDIAVSLDKSGNRLLMKSEGEVTEYGRYDTSTSVHRYTKPVVILINGLTASSGAISAFAFKDAIPQAVIIGEDSGDSLSVNESYPLPDGNYFNLMVLRIYSKYNIMQPLVLHTDIPVDHDYTKMFRDTDPQIVKAIAILKNMSGSERHATPTRFYSKPGFGYKA